MTTTATGSQSSTPRELLEAGSFVARCYSFIDYGTHQNTKFVTKDGSPVEQRKIRLAFELPTEMKVFDEAKGEQPLVLGKKYTLSLSDKAFLRQDLESRRGKPFTKEELKGFNLSNLIWVPCILSVWVNKFDDREFNQINGISPLMKGQVVDKQINPSVIFDLDNYTIEQFNTLPKFVKKEISTSNEGVLCDYKEGSKRRKERNKERIR